MISVRLSLFFSLSFFSSMDTQHFEIGSYALNQPVNDYPNAQKTSFLGRLFGSRKCLPGETPYDGGKIELLKSSWSVKLGVYQNRIIRITANWVCKNEQEMEKKFCELVKYCEQRFELDRPDCSRKDIKTWKTPIGVVTTNIQSLSINGRPTYFTISLEAISNPFVK